MIKRFGKYPQGDRLQRIESSPNFRDGSFKNVEDTSVNPDNVSIFTILKEMNSRPSTVKPSSEIPNVKTNLDSLNPTKSYIVWFGHSSYFLQIYGFKILVDPVFSGNASPFRFFGKAFDGANHFSTDDIPPIDLLVLTHDHYDHLDYPSIKNLNLKFQP